MNDFLKAISNSQNKNLPSYKAIIQRADGSEYCTPEFATVDVLKMYVEEELYFKRGSKLIKVETIKH